MLTKENLWKKDVRLLGWGESADAYHMTSPDPTGKGAEKAMRYHVEEAKRRLEELKEGLSAMVAKRLNGGLSYDNPFKIKL